MSLTVCEGAVMSNISDNSWGRGHHLLMVQTASAVPGWTVVTRRGVGSPCTPDNPPSGRRRAQFHFLERNINNQ